MNKMPVRLTNLLELLFISFKLGLTSFGGPAAHLGYFREEYVKRRKWLDEHTYADLVALCQFLPGPASSQVGMGIGIIKAGIIGGLVSFIGFTLPSVLALTIFAFYLNGTNMNDAGWLHGLKIVAVVIVLQAVLGMGKNLASSKVTATIAVFAAVAILASENNLVQILVILAAGAAGMLFIKAEGQPERTEIAVPVKKSTAIMSLFLFFGFLFALPLAVVLTDMKGVALFDSFYRSGALVFGGGHVVLPLLERELVPTGFISAESFLAGYGAAQAVPGPLFTFASFLGASINGWSGMLIATIAIFLPAFLLIVGTLPFWNGLRGKKGIQKALAGINAAVVGILLAALYNPIFTSTIHKPTDFALAAVLFTLLVFWKAPPWLIVILGAIGGSFL